MNSLPLEFRWALHKTAMRARLCVLKPLFSRFTCWKQNGMASTVTPMILLPRFSTWGQLSSVPMVTVTCCFLSTYYICNKKSHYIIRHQASVDICVTGKRGNVEINNSPQAGIEPGASRSKIQHSTEWAKEISH